jgi:NADH dehydrogenase/NADH:ubiquinone oxidoreductase subunit G
MAKEGQYIYDAAKENGIFIPTLCNYEGTKPVGSCRICTVMVNKRAPNRLFNPDKRGYGN